MDSTLIEVNKKFINKYRLFKKKYKDLERKVYYETEKEVQQLLDNYSDYDIMGFNYIDEMKSQQLSALTLIILSLIVLIFDIIVCILYPINALKIIFICVAAIVGFIMYNNFKVLKFIKFYKDMIREIEEEESNEK